MARYLWLRLYTGILDSHKIQSLPDKLFRALVNLWCVAKEHEGTLPSTKEIAWRLRVKPETVTSWLNSLCSRRLLDEQDGRYGPHDWDEHQYDSDHSTGRVARYRSRTRQTGATVGAYLKHRNEVFARDGNACVYCGSTENLCLDHIIPVQLGGPEDPQNLCVACKSCNSGKAGRTPDQAGYTILTAAARDAYHDTMNRLHITPVTVTDGDLSRPVTVTDTASVTPRARDRDRDRTETEPPTPKHTQTGVSPPEAFNCFWKRYPHKVGKDAACRAWLSLVETPADVEAVFACLERWEHSDQWVRKVYQKPENWLWENARSAWQDRPAEATNPQEIEYPRLP